MARIFVYLILAVVALVLLWWLFTAFLHALMVGFWIAVAVLLAFGMFRFRVGRRSGRGARQ
jgi:hypothetical protein